MKKISQTHNFESNKNDSSVIGKVVVATGAFASDPSWYTELTAQLTTIGGYVIAVLGAVIGIRLAPLAWTHIKAVLYR